MSGNNLHGTLTLASSSSTGSGTVTAGSNELGLAIGTTVANSASIQTLNIPLPSTAESCFFLVRMSSACTIVGDTATNGATPSFTSGAAVGTAAAAGNPVYIGPINTASVTQTNTNGVITNNTVQNVVALKITNTSGGTAALQELRLISTVVTGSNQAWFDDKTVFQVGGAPSPESPATMTWNTNT